MKSSAKEHRQHRRVTDSASRSPGPTARRSSHDTRLAGFQAMVDHSPRQVAQRRHVVRLFGRHGPATGPSAPPIQAKWREIDGAYHQWDAPLDGLQWYSHKKTGKLYYVIADVTQFDEEELKYYRKHEGALLSEKGWLGRKGGGFVSGTWEEADSEIVPANLPEPQAVVPRPKHAISPVGRWKELGERHSEAGTMEDVLKKMYLHGGVDSHDVVAKLKELRKLGPRWEELAADPGLMLRPQFFEALLELVKGEDVASPWEARKQVAKALGPDTAYRALWISHEYAKKLSDTELRKQEVLLPKKCFDAGSACDCDRVLDNIELLLRRHVESGGQSKAQSVTKSQDNAIAVANRIRLDSDDPYDPTKGVYLLTLRVPKIDLFYVGDFTTDYDSFLIHLGYAGKVEAYSRDIEQIVVGNIRGVNITKVELIRDPLGYAKTARRLT